MPSPFTSVSDAASVQLGAGLATGALAAVLVVGSSVSSTPTTPLLGELVDSPAAIGANVCRSPLPEEGPAVASSRAAVVGAGVEASERPMLLVVALLVLAPLQPQATEKSAPVTGVMEPVPSTLPLQKYLILCVKNNKHIRVTKRRDTIQYLIVDRVID